MEKTLWPSWRYGPFEESAVFECEADVPEGWVDHPSKVTYSKKATPTPSPTPDQPPAHTPTEARPGEVDADGWPWDETLHAATKSKTNTGLWRMKVGVSRPAAKPGFPKQALDL